MAVDDPFSCPPGTRADRWSDATAAGTSSRLADDGGNSGGDSGNQTHAATEAIHRLGEQVRELREFFSHFLAAKADGLKLTLRNLGIYAALGVVGLIAGATFVIVATSLLLHGMAGGLGSLFGGRLWLGQLVTGLLLLGLLAGGIIFGLKRLSNSSRRQVQQRYEQRQHRQRLEFGQDAGEKAQQKQRRQSATPTR